LELGRRETFISATPSPSCPVVSSTACQPVRISPIAKVAVIRIDGEDLHRNRRIIPTFLEKYAPCDLAGGVPTGMTFAIS
jgi:hypothetical protein